MKGAGPYSVGLCCARVSISSSGIITLTPSLIEVNGGNIMSIATSKLDPSTNTRYLYCVAKYSVTRHTISSSGISSATVIASGHAAGGSAYELELSADGSTLAWGNWYGTGSAGTITTMALTGSKPGLTYTFSLPGAIQSCYGLEFSPDPDYLYASINSGTTGSSGLYKLKRSTSTFTKLTSNTYNHTQLERARDGYIYAVNGDGYSSGTLGRINPATDNIDNNILSIPIISNQSSLLSSYVYRLPDQVDGDNYDYFFGVAKLNNSIKINGSTVSSTVPVNTYTCSAISLSQTGIGASSYRYTINKTDAAGNVLTGSSAYSFTTGLIASTPPATIDIKALHSGYLGTPLSAGYYYKIDFFVQNSCHSITVSGLIYNSTLSAASANFKLLDGGGNELNPNPVLPGYEVSAFGVGLNGKYRRDILLPIKLK